MARLFLATFVLAAAATVALAQNATATSGTYKPMTATPSSQNTLPNGQPKYVAPPAARSGEKGLRIGEGVADVPIEIKRIK